MSERNHVLQMENITMQFGGVVAVNNLSLEVNEGEIVALIGPNGAGKTTAFNVITGVYQPTNGQVLFHDKAYVCNHPRGKMAKLYKGENPAMYTSHHTLAPTSVLKVVRERVVAVTAPAAAVMKAQHVKARPAEVLREVIVFFAAGDAVEQQHCRVRALPCRRVQHGQQPAAFSLYQHAVDVRAAGSRAVMRFAVLKFLLHRVLLCQSAVSTAFSSLCLLRFFLYQSLP